MLQYYTLIYRAALDAPIRFIVPLFTIAPRTVSTVVGLTSGRILHIYALESGVRLFSIAASIRAFFVIFFSVNNSETLIKFLITYIYYFHWIPSHPRIDGEIHNKKGTILIYNGSDTKKHL